MDVCVRSQAAGNQGSPRKHITRHHEMHNLSCQGLLKIPMIKIRMKEFLVQKIWEQSSRNRDNQGVWIKEKNKISDGIQLYVPIKDKFS